MTVQSSRPTTTLVIFYPRRRPTEAVGRVRVDFILPNSVMPFRRPFLGCSKFAVTSLYAASRTTTLFSSLPAIYALSRDFHFASRIRAFIHQHASPHARFLQRTLFRSQLPSGGAALDGKPTGAPAFRVFLRHRSTRVPAVFAASLHSGRASASRHWQRPDPPQHVAEQSPGQMPFRQQEPVVPRMLHQPAPGFH